MSLDELPEVFNILKGDMSIVGPRPLLVQYLPLYNDFQKRRHEVRSGLTGYAQVHGRNAITWEEKFRLDVYYVDHVSFLMDVKVILQTVKKVFTREGIQGANTETRNPLKENMMREDRDPEQICIIGAGGHGKVVADIVIQSGNWVKGFLDDAENIPNTIEGIPVLGKSHLIKNIAIANL